MTHGSARRGFTLIELLVVIAIIAILAAILFPVFAKAREKARQSSCLSNMKQISVAAQMYAQDFDELTPRTMGYVTPATILAAQTEWFLAIQPYIKNKQLMICPSRTVNYFTSAGVNDTSWGGLSYGMNVWLSGIPLARINSVATTAQFGEIQNNYLYQRNDGTGWGPAAAHNDGHNVAFVDGHAKWIKGPPNAGCHWANGYPTPNEAGF